MKIQMIRSARKDNGFILMTVLWAIVLISLLSIIATNSFKREIRSTSKAEIFAQNQTLADGITELVVEQIGVSKQFRFNDLALKSGWPMGCVHQDYSVIITATDSSGLVDLNSSPRVRLKTVLQAAGSSGDELTALLGAIKDYTDPDNLTADGKNENIAYRAGGSVHLPKNSPFENVGELDQVAGMTARLFSRIRPYLTVYSRKADIHLPASPPIVVAAMTGTAISSVEIATTAAQNSRQARSVSTLYDFDPANRTYEVRVMIMHPSGANTVMQAVSESAPGSDTGFKYLIWNKAAPLESERLLAKMPNLPVCFQ